MCGSAQRNQKTRDRISALVSQYPKGTRFPTQELLVYLNSLKSVKTQVTMMQLKYLLRDVPELRWEECGIWRRV